MAAKNRKGMKSGKGPCYRGVVAGLRLAFALVAMVGAWPGQAQTNAPPAVYVRSYVNDVPNQPLITVTVTGAVNVASLTIEETLPGAASALSVSGDGVYLPALNAIRWGPYFNTVATNVSYRITGLPASYPVNGGSWMDGHWYFSPGATLVTVLPAAGGSTGVPSAPPQVATPAFSPPSGASVPVSVTITDATPGAVIYYTLNGSLPTQGSTLYTGAVALASASVLRAAAFTNGWTPSIAAAAFYGPLASPVNAQVTRSVSGNGTAAPVVTFNVTPGTNANCIAITESLAPGIGATSISSGGIYVASNNVVLWGPFFGTSGFSLSYQAVGLPGAYPAKVSWSVDGVSGSETTGTNLVIAGSGVNGTIPTPTPQVQTPVLTPAMASNLPVAVTITDATPGAVIYYTLDGSLPTQSSTLYTGAVSLVSASVLRAVAFTNGWAPSGAALGEYVPPITTNTVSVAHSVSGNGDFMPTVSLTATPQGVVNCYAVIETIPFGAAPSGLSGDGVWDPLASVIRWGPYLDNQPRVFSYNVRGASGSYPLSGQVSVNGYSMATDATNVLVNANSTGSAPVNNLSACTSAYFSYNVDINPAPGVVTVTSASGTVTWGDGTQSLFTQPVTTLLKLYTSAGTYPIVIAANWTGTAPGLAVSGFATRTDLVQVVTSCGGLQIVTQPSNQEALVGGSVQFTVSASGSLPITYRWYFNTNTALFSPSSNASLSLSNITPQSAGWYSVVITNASGSVTSSFASLTVVSPLVTGLVRGTDGKVTLTFVGLPNVTTRIWATTNVGLPASWQPIFTNTTTAANGTWQFIDAKATNYPARFYRFSTP